uniref:Uncharacterized protein n=1 Tax=Caenorhabditis japonica TaxID=281687 RepID=A0A8R1EEE4_CAEJA
MKDSKVIYSAVNFLENYEASSAFFADQTDSSKNYVLLGDMFYDSDFAELLFSWLKRIQEKHEICVLVGDPDRHPLSEAEYLKKYGIS